MAEFSDREDYFKAIYGDNPTAAQYRGHYEPDSRVAYREILRLRKIITKLNEVERSK